MKKAKVSKGIVRHVWPWEKVLPDGSRVIKQIPPIYVVKNSKFAHCIVDVPDEVQPGWLWNGKEYAPRPPKPAKRRPKQDSLILQVLSEELGLDYEVLLEKLIARKKRRNGAIRNPTD